MLIFHISTRSDWRRAQVTGRYETSTRGRTLDQEGFLHASRRDQVPGVFRRYYADAGEPLVLLTIDTDRLTVPWREESVGPESTEGTVGTETYPHIYGPLDTDAVVAVQELNRQGGTEPFTVIFAREMGLRMVLAVAAMLLAFAGAGLGGRTGHEWGPFLGALGGLVAAGAAYLLLRRLRRSR